MIFYVFEQKILQKFCKYRFYEYLCIRKRKNLTRNVAQLVAHYVRDVGVGRSSRLIPTENRKLTSPDGGIGRRAGLKHQWSNIHPGSTPGLGTRKRVKYLNIKYLTLFFLFVCSQNVPIQLLFTH